MLDIVKELIPLVEGATNGAVWLVLAYFGVLILKMVLWTVGVLLLARTVANLIKSMTGHGEELLYGQIKDNKQSDVNVAYAVNKEHVRELMRALGGPDKYVSTFNLPDMIKHIENYHKR